ncbi:MAG: HAD-IIB family hydrolase [Culicoidibacterales bacterium]
MRKIEEDTMIKYFICDLDGTLVRRKIIRDEQQNIIQFRVTDEDKAAIAEFIAGGGKFIVATGRADFEIENFAALEAIGPVSYRISCNGAMIRTQSGELVFEQRLATNASRLVGRELAKLAGRLSIIEASDKDWVYYHGQVNHDDVYKQNHIWSETDIIPEFGETILPIKYFLQGDAGAIQAIVEAINQELPDEFEIFNDIQEVNLGPKDVSKGSAVKQFLQTMGVNPEEIAVIGDAANDISMFATTPNSFTFHHASEQVQQEANYLVSTVAEALQKLKA